MLDFLFAKVVNALTDVAFEGKTPEEIAEKVAERLKEHVVEVEEEFSIHKVDEYYWLFFYDVYVYNSRERLAVEVRAYPEGGKLEAEVEAVHSDWWDFRFEDGDDDDCRREDG